MYFRDENDEDYDDPLAAFQGMFWVSILMLVTFWPGLVLFIWWLNK